jgi:DNA-binding response OmpR family regulator
MVVEDNDDQRAILEMVLKNAGYQVDGVAGGEEALNYLATARPQLIVTDLMMPHIDGAELVRRLKSTVEWQDIPVLVLTVLSDKDKEYLLLDLGAEDYCEKTISRKLLLKRIENLLRRAS